MIVDTIENVRHEHGAGYVKRLCQAADLSRATFYRLRSKEPAANEEETQLRGLIQEIALKWPSYGYRRITAELRRRGHRVNHKRVLRLMREDNLLCLRKKRFAVTTDSDHNLPVYPNLASDLEPNSTDELWVADLTYVRLRREFVYLAVVLDAFSRRYVQRFLHRWALGRSLEASLTITALWQALESRSAGPGLVHHSDRGVQYASRDYTDLLNAHDIRISMSRRACPYDNAQAESFIKTLKCEEVYPNEYETLQEARASIGDFLDRVYNEERLHSALGYCPPAEFEQMLLQPTTTLQPITTP
jgi:transposase InsO family protein